MTRFACPSCGAELIFRSAISVFQTCAYCQSNVVRHGVDLEAIGKSAVLTDDVSPLQIGTGGVYQKVAFALVGRVCQQWENGRWNEWFAQFDDGRTGWLGEAQGFYMMSRELEKPGALPRASELSPGNACLIAGTSYTVDDIKKAKCVATQGELPMEVRIGRECISVDLSGDGDAFASLDYSGDKTRAFVGHNLEYDRFRFTNVRELDGW